MGVSSLLFLNCKMLSAQQFTTWIKPLRCEPGAEGWVLLAPNRFVLQFIKDRFLARIEALASEVLGEPALLELKIGAPVKVEPPVMTSSSASPSASAGAQPPSSPTSPSARPIPTRSTATIRSRSTTAATAPCTGT